MIADCLDCHETQACKLLNNAGANPWLDEYTANISEVIPRALVINLAAIRASDRVGASSRCCCTNRYKTFFYSRSPRLSEIHLLYNCFTRFNLPP